MVGRIAGATTLIEQHVEKKLVEVTCMAHSLHFAIPRTVKQYKNLRKLERLVGNLINFIFRGYKKFNALKIK